ncbi:hypothetical protein [Pseudomonas nitroreducens]|uniref:hypothetical protein n=1 Tax=Pseudomonas nitroreducens TaxID=46680 RepID=UPI0038286AA2
MKRNIQYTELKKIAKKYNNTFENHLNKRSLKSKKFWLSIILAATIPVSFSIGTYFVIKNNFYLAGLPFLLLYTAEVIAILLKTAHDNEQTIEKIRRERISLPETKGLIIDDSECRRAWLAREIPVQPSKYPELAAEFERIENLILHQEKSLSGLDARLLRHLLKVPRTLFLFILPVLAALLTYVGQNIITNTAEFSLNSLGNSKSLGFIALSISLTAGGLFILSFMLSLLTSLGSFIIDTTTPHGCSAKSRTRLKRDLYIFSELFPETESSNVKSPSTARYLHSEAQ